MVGTQKFPDLAQAFGVHIKISCYAAVSGCLIDDADVLRCPLCEKCTKRYQNSTLMLLYGNELIALK